MKKHLTIACLVAGVSGVCSAQSNATLYGIIDIGLEQVSVKPGSNTLSLTSGIQSGSRWGLKGSEDLGGGLSASYTLESGFDATSGLLGQGGRIFGRQSWLGLNGGFGSVKFGRQYTPLFIALDTIDPFDMGITGDGSGIGAVFRLGGVRTDNTVNYSTPSVGGLSGSLAYTFGEIAGSTSAGRQIGASATYESGPLTLVAATHNQNLVAAGSAAGQSKTFALGGMYDFKAAEVHVAYATNRDNDRLGVRTEDSRDQMLGVSAPFGPLSLLAAYISHRDHLAPNRNANYWEFGATYDLSKRTNLYSSYSTIRNDSAAAVGSGIPGADISWLNVGIRHRF